MNSFRTIAILLLIFVCAWACTPSAEKSNNERTQVEMMTDYGTILIELYNETPLHRDNFINLAKNNAYDSLLFHRVIDNFMIQGGDPDSRLAQANDTLGEGDAPYRVKAEFHKELFHKKGVLAAARDDNPEKASSAMQFYIVHGKIFTDSLLDRLETNVNVLRAVACFDKDSTKQPLIDSLLKAKNRSVVASYDLLKDSLLGFAQNEDVFELYAIPQNQREIYKTLGGTPHLDQRYTVFGEVVKGIEVVDSIAKVSTSLMDRPIIDLRIIKVRVLE